MDARQNQAPHEVAALSRLEGEYAALRARVADLTTELEDKNRHLAAMGETSGRSSLAGMTVRDVERRVILDTLARTQGNRTQAARLLDISIRTLRNKLAEYRTRGASPVDLGVEG